MQVIDGINNLPSLSENTIVAMGNFDGIHLGHQKILRFLFEKATKSDLHSLVLTFSPHPEKIFGKDPIKMIQTLSQRLKAIEKFKVQMVLVVPFDKGFANLSSQDFIQGVLIETLKAKEIIIGENFRFGKNREGNTATLQNLGSLYDYKIHSISSVSKASKIISSSVIRNALQEGKVKEARRLLGRPYSIEGKIIKGNARGKNLGFPTANIITENEITPPGVFISTTEVNSKTYPSLTNIGCCPTFNQQEKNIESFLIDFKANLYGKKMKICFLEKIRDEIRFKKPKDLSQQIQKDLIKARTYFGL